MNGLSYYNDNEKYCADILRAHVTLGDLPEGYIDERSITELHATDFVGYSHVHLFAGIGGFPLALTSWPFAEYVRHEWAGAWVCSCFRNENGYDRKHKDGYLSSELILQAVAATRWYCLNVWMCGEPERGFITFVDASKVRSKEPGTCYRASGWEQVGYTKQRGLLALSLPIDRMPEPACPHGGQPQLWEAAV